MHQLLQGLKPYLECSEMIVCQCLDKSIYDIQQAEKRPADAKDVTFNLHCSFTTSLPASREEKVSCTSKVSKVYAPNCYLGTFKLTYQSTSSIERQMVRSLMFLQRLNRSYRSFCHEWTPFFDISRESALYWSCITG